MKQVDFSNPTRRDLSEIVVTGPGPDPIMSAQDLSGREVSVRKSLSFFQSIEQLNAEMVKMIVEQRAEHEKAKEAAKKE